MERLTTRNIAGVAVYKHPFECERCGDTIWRLPDYGNGSPTEKLADYEDAEEQGICGKWIPVSERLPEDEVDVLVWFEYYRYGNYNRLFQTIGISYTYNGEWSGFVNGQSGWIRLKVIAWMPLPEPYRESEEEYGEV